MLLRKIFLIEQSSGKRDYERCPMCGRYKDAGRKLEDGRRLMADVINCTRHSHGDEPVPESFAMKAARGGL